MRLREALADRHGVDPAQVVLGNGADELIRLCAVATLDAGDRAAFPWPSFPSYVAAAACCGAEAVRCLPGSDDAARRGRGDCLHRKPEQSDRTTREPGRLLEAFPQQPPDRALTRPTPSTRTRSRRDRRSLAQGAERLCVLRTFSKVHGLAALRVGYALASPDVADALDRVRPIFNVNQPAQEAALASLHERGALALRVDHARRGRAFLADAWPPWIWTRSRPRPTSSTRTVGNGEEVARRLLREGVIVRALTGFGAPQAIRVTSGTDEENEIFAQALRRIIV